MFTHVRYVSVFISFLHVPGLTELIKNISPLKQFKLIIKPNTDLSTPYITSILCQQ